MSMYNEVFAKCPKCGFKCYVQIPQVVRGFGGFDFSDLSTFDDLDDEEIEEVREYVLDELFLCEDSDGCGNSFNPLDKQTNRRAQIIGILFDEHD